MLFRPAAATKQFSRTTKPFFAFGAELRKRSMVIKSATTTADSAGSDNRRQSNASPQLPPCCRLRTGWPLDRRFVGEQPAGYRHLRLQRLPDRHLSSPFYRCCGPLRRNWDETNQSSREGHHVFSHQHCSDWRVLHSG